MICTWLTEIYLDRLHATEDTDVLDDDNDELMHRAQIQEREAATAEFREFLEVCNVLPSSMNPDLIAAHVLLTLGVQWRTESQHYVRAYKQSWSSR